MNEGENSGMPNTPVFSSPNTSPDDSQPIQPATPVDPNAPTATASLPGEDPSRPAGVISSGNSMPAATRPRLGFTRKFKAKTAEQQLPAQPAFSNAPDYFNQAVGDIALADENAAAQKKKIKKIIFIAGVALAALGCVLAVVLIMGQASKPSANKVKAAFNRYANFVLYGEEKDGEIGSYDASANYAIKEKFTDGDDDYYNHVKELFDKFFKEYNAAAKNGIYEKGGAKGYKSLVYGVIYSRQLNSLLSSSDLLISFFNDGYDATEKLIEQKYNDIIKKTDELLINDWYYMKLNDLSLYQVYADLGCYKDKQIIQSCKNSAITNKNVIAIMNDQEKLTRHAYQEKKSLQEDVIKKIWDMKDELK